jgi:hypothetical protein
MDITDLHNRYDISVRKLKRMASDGVLRLGKSSASLSWQRLRSDVKKGNMSARSVALAYRFPDKLNAYLDPTHADLRVISAHFALAELPADNLDLKPMFGLVKSATESEQILSLFITFLKRTIPTHDVTYLYVAVRMMLSCETEPEIEQVDKYIRKALAVALVHPRMLGWSHREAGRYGKHRIIYHRPPKQYDL